MASKELGDGLNAIGQLVADVLGKTPNDVFVFIEAGDQWYGGAIFENLDDKVLYHEFEDDTLGEIILPMWEAAEPDKKWSILLFDIKDGRFEAEFLYTDDLEHHPFEYDYREDALVARYGDKPVIYPELDEGYWHELTEEDMKDVEVIDIDPDTLLPIDPKHRINPKNT
jgi:hypothetical protein